MIFDCKCGTKFKVNEGIYGKEGVSVHCGVCSRTFFLSPETIKGDALSESISTESTLEKKITTTEKVISGNDKYLMLLKEKRELDSILSRIAKGEEIDSPERQETAENYQPVDNAVAENDKHLVLLREKRELDDFLTSIDGKLGASPDTTIKTKVKVIETPQFKQPPVAEIKKKSDAFPDATIKTTVKVIETPQFKQPPVVEIKKKSDESPVSQPITKAVKEKEVVIPYVEKIREEKPAVGPVIKPKEEENKVLQPPVTKEKEVAPPEGKMPSPQRIRWAMTILFTIFLCLATEYIFIMLDPDIGYNATKWISKNVPVVDTYLEVKVPTQVEIVADRIKITNIRQRMISNSLLGVLRVVEGDAENSAPYPVSRIKVGGDLLDARKLLLVRTYAFCGNIIPDNELAVMSEDDIQKALFVPEGQNGANSMVQPGGLVPFMIVFIREPSGVVNATVKPWWAKRY